MLLEKILQSQGFGSRKYCQQLIKNGSVQIEGQVCENPKQNINTDQLCFQVFGEEYQYREHLYIVLNKPKVMNVHIRQRIIKVYLVYCLKF
jgi:16S rRNA pseudouridine516 synthase